MKLGIIGTGKIVQEILPLFTARNMEKITLLSTERSLERAETLRAQYRLDRVFTDCGLFLADDIDTVYIGIPNALHFSFAREALLHGKDVILEKPAASCVRELEELLHIAKANHLILMEAVSTRYLPAFRKLKSEIRSLSGIKLAVFHYAQYSSRYDDFRRGIRVPAFDRSCSGGALYDINFYNIYAAVELFGEPLSVNYFANMQKGIDTSGMAILSYDGFQVCCIGAKDCQGKNHSVIQCEDARIEIEEPFNAIAGYRIFRRTDPESTSGYTFKPEHRLLPELEQIIKILQARDYDAAAEANKISLAVMRVLEKARRGAGLEFDCDVPSEQKLC